MAMIPDEQGIFYVLIVGGGPGAGEFTYDASGNLRSANVGQVTTDPVQGITCQQGFSTFNGQGAVINLLSTSKGAFFQYQDLGTASQGSMILVVASAAGSDPVTAVTYQAGMTGIDPAFGDAILTTGANIDLFQALFTKNAHITANTGSGATSPFVSVAGPEQGHAGHAVVRVYGVSADGTVAQGVIISDTDPPVRAAKALLEVQGTAALKDSAAPAAVSGYAQLFAETAGFLGFIADSAADGNQYDMARLTKRINSNITINSTAPSAIFTVANLSPGTYEITVWLVTSNTTAADAAGFAFAFTGTATGLVDYEDISGSSPATVTYAASSTFTTTFNGQGVAGNQRVLAHLTLVVTVAGTFSFTGKELVNLNTVTVFSGSRMDICPVVAS